MVRASDVNPTAADLGGVTSVLYELEHSCKPSLPGCDNPSQITVGNVTQQMAVNWL